MLWDPLFGIEISKRSLFTQQTALQTTGHNVANANTQGLFKTSCQYGCMLSRMKPASMTRSLFQGKWVRVLNSIRIKRIREEFLG